MIASVPCAYLADTPQKNRCGTSTSQPEVLNSLAASNVPTNHEVILKFKQPFKEMALHGYRCGWSCISLALVISCSLGPYFYRRMSGRCAPH